MGEDINVDVLIQTLESKSASQEEKNEVYLQLANQLREDSLSLVSLDVTKNSRQFCEVLKMDLQHNHITANGLQILGFCLHDKEAVGNLSADMCRSILSLLCDCVEKTEDKNLCAKSLWCLHQQNIPKDIVSQQVESVLSAVEQALLRWKMQSSVVEHEASQIIYRLLKDYRREMDDHIVRWGKLLLPLMAHKAPKIHQSALEVVKTELPALLSHQKELVQALIPEFKLRIGSELKGFFTCQQEVHALECWEIFVQICGKELHHGSFINMLLPIMELAFKGSNEVKVRAFQAWQVLIDNFATSHEILTCPKRIKLIMQVLKINNAKTETVAMAKLQVWWHFIWLLGPKAPANFEQVCLPLLHFCVGGSKSTAGGLGTPRALPNGTSPKTPRMNLSGGSTMGSTYPKIPCLQLRGCEVLAHLLGRVPEDIDIPKFSFSLDPLTHDLITGPGFFVKQSNVFVHCAAELICDIGSQIPEGLLLHIWFSLIAHMRNGLESGSRSEMKDAFTVFLTQFQVIVLSGALEPKLILKLFNAVCCLPSKALNSTAYNVNCGEKLHGTPALFLMQLLLTPTLLKDCSSLESYNTLYSKLVNIGIGGPGSLEFAQSVLHLLDINTEFIEGAESLWRFWSTVVNPLQEFIVKTGEVNQGDALEHNFSCLYAVLLFPIKHQLPEKIPQVSVKTLQKTWTEVYQTFARLSALVTNAEANISCEDLCHQINKSLKDEESLSLQMLDFLSHASQTIINTVDFSSLGSSSAFNIGAMQVSPAKWTKKKHKPMENLHSLAVLIKHLLEALNTHIKSGEKKEASNSSSPQGPANALTDCLCTMFTHLTSSSVLVAVIGHLSQPIGDLIQESIKKTCAKLFNNNFMQKLEKLWNDICTSLQNRYLGTYDSDFLSKLSPLLEATFLHPRRTIKNQTALFWSATFGRAPQLLYPEALRPVLAKIKEKSSILLPGWVSIPVTVVEETPVSQMSQPDSQAPEPFIPGMPSPRKIHGSFLNKAVSPNIKNSPARHTEKVTRSPGAARKNLSINDLQKEDFVVIKSPPKKKRILTEHQKEVLKEKKVIPTMYNTLDHSQDVSLMFGAESQFGSDTQSEPQTPDSLNVIDSSLSQYTSQRKDRPTKGRTTRKSSSEASDREDSQNSKKELGVGKRRRSVRFKETAEEVGQGGEVEKKSAQVEADRGETSVEKSQEIGVRRTTAEKSQSQEIGVRRTTAEKSQSQEEFEAHWDQTLSKMMDEVDKMEKNSIEHFSVIKDTISSSQEQKDYSNDSNSTDSQNLSSGNSSQSQQAVRESVKKMSDLSQTKASSSGNDESAITKASDCGSNEKETGSSKSSFGSTGYVAPENVMEAVEMECLTYKSTSSSGADKSSENGGKKDGEMETSQSLLMWTNQLKEISPAKVNSPLKKLSQESSGSSSSRSTKHFASPAKRGRTKALEKSSKGSHKIDEWLIKSPEKSSQESGISSQGSDKSSGTSSSSSQPLEVTVVEETQSPKSMKTRVSPNSVPIQETPPPPANKEPAKFGNTRGSTRKLFTKGMKESSSMDLCEDSNIIPGSPESKSSSLPLRIGTPVLKLKRLTEDEIKHFSPRKGDVGFGTPREERSSQGSAVGVHSEDSNHEHDDFSDVLPLEQVPMLSSQGFETQADRKTSVDQADNTLMTNTCTENLFSQNENNSQENKDYNPKLHSTFQPNGEGKDVLGTENLKSSQESENSEFGSEKGSQSEDLKAMESAATYDPKVESTMAQDTPRRGRKRKQETPKKLSPESSRPKRTRKGKGEDKTPRGKAGESKKGKQKVDSQGTAGDEKEKVESSSEKKSASIESTSSEQVNDENLSLEKFTGKVSQNTENNTEKENYSTSDERQLDSEGLFLEKSQEKVTKNPPSQKFDEEEKLESLEVITAKEKGEKTPTSRSTAEVPQRKSTTKKKMEAAKKRSKKKVKGGEKVMSDSSEDDMPLAQTLKESTKSKSKLESKIDKTTEQEELGQIKEEDNMEGRKSSDSSDDNVPLNSLCGNAEVVGMSQEEREEAGSVPPDGQKENPGADVGDQKMVATSNEVCKKVTEEKGSGSDGKARKMTRQKFMPAKTSPLSNRLRSSQGTLRSGKPTRRSLSPGKSPKQLSLKKSTKRKSLDPNLLSVVIEDSEEPTPMSEKPVDELEKKENTNVSETEPLKEKEQMAEKERDTEKDILDMLNEPKIEETPVKIAEDKTDGGDFAMFERNTDSKLVVVPRKFEKRTIARRSILKATSPSANLTKFSPLRKPAPFHPIKLGQIFAPSASPSASILKRRRLSGEIPRNSPSPPSKKKQRRVSFADPVTFTGDPVTLTGTPLSLAASTPVINTEPTVSSSALVHSSPAVSTSSEPSQTQDSIEPSTLGSYVSVTESQITTEAIYPELVDCSQTVDRVLPQLTTSMWSRGLGQLVKARNIHTIGDLSRLSEKEIDNLPIRSPKVSTVRKVLSVFESQNSNKKPKASIEDTKDSNDSTSVSHSSTKNDDEVEVLPSMEAELCELSPIMKNVNEDLNRSIADEMNASEDLLEKVNMLVSADGEDSVGFVPSLRTPEPLEEQVSDKSKSSIPEYLDQLTALLTVDSLKSLRTGELFDAHEKLLSLANNVATAMKNRICIVTVSEWHPIIREGKTVSKINFEVDGMNRLDNKISGKGKRGAQLLTPSSPLCEVTCTDESKYTVICGVRAQLIEANENLVKSPQLLTQKPQTEGYIAIVLPKLGDFESATKNLLSKEEYMKIRFSGT
ncbi:telomere-associated protein RIF1-like [Saccostrea echinata]|uniref:telomere-associated protein RIF1-like n=1 Tax=Saccostrea echinata TaxID=191078 RepID=UPI002A810A97|nr:telomere-associated protein RIF1-like [Saccostrea echinata]